MSLEEAYPGAPGTLASIRTIGLRDAARAVSTQEPGQTYAVIIALGKAFRPRSPWHTPFLTYSPYDLVIRWMPADSGKWGDFLRGNFPLTN